MYCFFGIIALNKGDLRRFNLFTTRVFYKRGFYNPQRHWKNEKETILLICTYKE
jgi:hypothetical protein